MENIHEKINKEYQAGYLLKEEARKTTLKLDKYKQASEHLDNASTLCKKVMDDKQSSSDDVIQSEVFYNYYLSEKHSCLFSYFYENRLTDEAKENQTLSIKYINEAILIIENKSSACSNKTSEYLKTFLPRWNYMLKAKEAAKYSPDARRFWDDGKLVEALDCYRRMTSLQKEAIELAKKNDVEPVFERIALGNYVGMMANMSSTLARILLEKSNGSRPKQIQEDDAIELVRHTLEAAQLARIAFENNPEWQQYIDGAKVMERNVINFLKDNPNFWKTMLINFENFPEVITFMKNIDSKKFRETEVQLYFKDNKIGKLWSFGSFWIVILLIIAALVVFIMERGFAWWQLLLTFVVIETLFLIIGAFSLKTVGDLSEESFIKLIKISLAHQFRQFKIILKKINVS